MRIALVDPIDWDYTVESAYQRPLGGSQSAVCYLAEALARRGHEVLTVTHTKVSGRHRGVDCASFDELTASGVGVRAIDFCIIVSNTEAADWCRWRFGSRPRLVLWMHHAADQPAVSELARQSVIDAHDAFVFVSEWQRRGYIERFGILPERTVVQRNAVAPAFEGLFTPGSEIGVAKTTPPVLAYTSTPFRGLDVLIEVFPAIRRDVPGVTLKVFSSMQVYMVEPREDALEFGSLYRACREIEGIEYVGSLPQPELARQLRCVACLAYPNTFAETSGIVVMEAMAAGCWIVTSRLGALAETTAGFGELVPCSGPRDVDRREFQRAVVEFLERRADANQSGDVEQALRGQIARVTQQFTWARRAEEWERWLSQF